MRGGEEGERREGGSEPRTRHTGCLNSPIVPSSVNSTCMGTFILK